MPGNYIKIYEVDSKKQESVKLDKAEKLIKNISSGILSGVIVVKPDKLGLIAKLINNFWQKRVNKSDKSFFAADSCNSCLICERICPADNIRMADKKPEWLHRCQECLACMHYCPMTAIQTKNTLNRGRYHHPEVSANDMIRR
jgi:MinD superfamily P-loop ATPase